MSWQGCEVSAASETASNDTTSPVPSAIAGSSRQVARSAGVVVNRRMSAPARVTAPARRSSPGMRECQTTRQDPRCVTPGSNVLVSTVRTGGLVTTGL